MKIIRNAQVFKVTLPEYSQLLHHMAQGIFQPVPETMVGSYGFVPNKVTGELLTPIAEGFSMSVRIDEKILPRASVNAAVAEAIAEREQADGVELTKEEKGLIKDVVIADLITKALVKTTVVTAFYHASKQLLIVATANKEAAQSLAGQLIKVCGSIKPTTIHVATMTHDLTGRLQNLVTGEIVAFAGFKVGAYILLKKEDRKVVFDQVSVSDATEGILEALNDGMQVEALRLIHKGAVSFKIMKDFSLRRIDFMGESTEDEDEGAEERDAALGWRVEAGKQLIELADVIEALCAMFDYKPEPESEAADA